MNLPISASVDCNATSLISMFYKDLAQPGVKSLGQALKTICELPNTILLPLKFANEKARLYAQKSLEDYRMKLEAIPEDEICDVNPAVGIPILDKFTYITDDDLRELYINLLVSASWKKTENLAHPSALSIIGSLSPDEARILHHMSRLKNIPFLRLFLKPTAKGQVEIRQFRYLSGIESKVDLDAKENMNLYFDNFIALGLYQYYPGDHLVDERVYTRLRNEYQALISQIESNVITRDPDHALRITNEMLKRSAIGDRFVETCCLEIQQDK